MNTPHPLAVITGASSGIGFELAGEFARHGYDLAVTAEDELLDDAAARLRSHGTQVHSTRVDLATSDGVETLMAELSALGRPVSAAVLGAGIGHGGAFLEAGLTDLARVIDVNVSSTVHLTHRLLSDMARRGEGRILVVSSVAAEIPGPYHAVYNASKAFLKSFAEALHSEVKDSGVSVTALMPGATDTRFFVRAGLLDTRLGRAKKDDPALVARQGYRALMDGRTRKVAGSLRTRAEHSVTRLFPLGARAGLHRRWAQPHGSRSHL
ncbi:MULTISPECIES: SDR family oxidoreductase [unclassified Streptomyces]|uniref:SDR family NAD(P)-dependent oxidoreductase n=1 Tax=unclassified Streptomyces TaxID=2593676 RepID=UPI00225AE341|nr:SDR family NAD(P)-dependent oxidoreductase [Streptomyces sp. NBC_00047]MCX5613462.1 SDR family NAD(P)-dependent oxidoreductase [Streptomyces sp. NBC_00047]